MTKDMRIIYGFIVSISAALMMAVTIDCNRIGDTLPPCANGADQVWYPLDLVGTPRKLGSGLPNCERKIAARRCPAPTPNGVATNKWHEIVGNSALTVVLATLNAGQNQYLWSGKVGEGKVATSNPFDGYFPIAVSDKHDGGLFVDDGGEGGALAFILPIAVELNGEGVGGQDAGTTKHPRTASCDQCMDALCHDIKFQCASDPSCACWSQDECGYGSGDCEAMCGSLQGHDISVAASACRAANCHNQCYVDLSASCEKVVFDCTTDATQAPEGTPCTMDVQCASCNCGPVDASGNLVCIGG